MNSKRTINTVGVVGAGAMGRGIAQLFVQSGLKVFCYDTSSSAVTEAVENVNRMIERSVEKGRLPKDILAKLKTNLVPANSLSDFSNCDLVIEAIIEDVSIKQKLFNQLEDIVSTDAILVSNTSSLVIAEIAALCKFPDRVAGLHFFNPVPLMKVVEIIAAVRTDPDVVEILKSAVETTGHRAVVTEDQPGFLVNHAGRGLYTEGLRIVEEQVATPEIVDTILREAAGFRMGPFELMDLTGLDVSGKVMESIYQQFLQEPRFRPSTLVPPRMAAGLYGRKTGQGWYRYEDGKRIDSDDATKYNVVNKGTVWLDSDGENIPEIKNLIRVCGLQLADNEHDADLIIIQPWGEDASHYGSRHGFDATKIVAIDPLPAFDKHRTLMITAITSSNARDLAYTLFTSDGVSATTINDSPGFICQRVLATIVNIATNIAQRAIASVEDLEDSVRIGLGYPSGPLKIGDTVGAEKILEILTQQQKITGDDRYRPSLWLSRRAMLGQSLLTLEAKRS